MNRTQPRDIRVSGVGKRFGDKRVLRHFSATFSGGSVNVIMGPSGCGKTTLLQILMGFMRADEGQVDGVPHHRSAVFQEDRLCEDFSAVSNVRAVCGRRVPQAAIVAHLERLGLAGSLYQPVRELSGGMRRRVAIARAMLAPAEIVFLDEPFKGLDEKTRDMTLAYVLEQTRGKTVIAVTHSREEADRLGGTLLGMTAAGSGRDHQATGKQGGVEKS
jgi:NitT/TauT family transport system ATP-binding protein